LKWEKQVIERQLLLAVASYIMDITSTSDNA
jgi:hypothetical protein